MLNLAVVVCSIVLLVDGQPELGLPAILQPVLPPGLSPDLICPGGICPPQFCLYKRKLYVLGQTFKDDCNECTCSKPEVTCTEKACLPPPKCKPGFIAHPTKKCGGIAGLKCPPDYECDMSNVPKDVSDGLGHCCKVDCKLVPCPNIEGCAPKNIVKLPGQCCRSCAVDCSAVQCAQVINCLPEDIYTPAGQCCPACKKPRCPDGSKPLPNKECEGFSPVIERCPASYFCDKSSNSPLLPDLPGICCRLDCRAKLCIPVIGCAPENIYTPPGECCAVCRAPKCRNGNEAIPGIRCEVLALPSRSSCPADSECELSTSISPISSELRGICCRSTCDDRGITRRDGEVFFRDCNTCECSKGNILCTKKLCSDCRVVRCAQPTCPVQFIPPGECCPHCKDCSIVSCVKPDGCSAKDTIIPPGECCPQCKGSCKVGNKWINNGVSFRDDCNTCQCMNGNVLCTLIACPPKCKPGLVAHPNHAECGGIQGIPCPEGYTCNTPDGTADAFGVCCKAPQCKPGYVTHPLAKCGEITGFKCPTGFTCDSSHVPEGTSDALGLCCKKSEDCRLVKCRKRLRCPKEYVYTPYGKCCPDCLPRKCKNGRKQLPGVKCGGSTGLECKKRYFCDTSLIENGFTDFGFCCPGKSCKEKRKRTRHGQTYTKDCYRCTCYDGKVVCEETCRLTCEYMGKIYQEGETEGQYCDTCTCTKGKMICPKKCASKPGLTCFYMGKKYKEGETAGEYCRTCTCINGKMICPNKCVKKKPCATKEGIEIEHGNIHREYCNTCTCNDGKLACTKKLCLKKKPCITKEGITIDHGKVHQEYCKTCTCNDGNLACTRKNCVKKKPCITKDGITIDHGKVHLEDCKTCTCYDGNLACTKKLCPKRSCIHNDIVYKHGETYGEYCNTCTCTDGTFVCPKKSQCVKDKPCIHKGQTYTHDQTFPDGCFTCRCENGVVRCSKKVCPQLRCANQYIPKGQCCPVCVPVGY